MWSVEGLIGIGQIDIDSNLEGGLVAAREKGLLLGVEETRTRAVGYLGCEGGPYLHELMASERGGKAKLSFAVEVEILDEMRTSISTGRMLCGGDGGHG